MNPLRLFFWIHAKLLGNNVPLKRYVVTVALITAVPVIISSSVAVFFDLLQLETSRLIPDWRLGNPTLNMAVGISDVLVFSPLVETGLTLIPIKLLRLIKLPAHLIPVVSGIFWGLVHMHYHGALLGMMAAWPFYCFTVVLLNFEKPSLDRAWLIASSVHGVHNILALTCSLVLSQLS